MSLGETMLFAKENSYSGEFACMIRDYLERAVQAPIKLENNHLKVFRNGEYKYRAGENLRGRDVYFIADTSLAPNDWWAEVLLTKDMVLNASAKSMTLVSPNLFYSRQDRKDESRVPISARAVAASIAPGLKKIITMDLHAGQIQGFYPAEVPVDNLYSFPAVARYFSEEHKDWIGEAIFVSPDAGGVNRVKSFTNRLEKLLGGKKVDMGFVHKDRPEAGEVGEVRYVGPEFKGRKVIFIDDMIDSGKTLRANAKYFREGEVEELFCYGTHGLFTLGPEGLMGDFDKIFTSNTHRQQHHDVGIIDVTPVIAEAIYRAQTNQSISELFE